MSNEGRGKKNINFEAIRSIFFHAACNNEQLASFELSLLLHQVFTSHLKLSKAFFSQCRQK